MSQNALFNVENKNTDPTDVKGKNREALDMLKVQF